MSVATYSPPMEWAKSFYSPTARDYCRSMRTLYRRRARWPYLRGYAPIQDLSRSMTSSNSYAPTKEAANMSHRSAILIAALIVMSIAAFAGGPLVVGGPTVGTPGQTITWAQGAPINYRIDGAHSARTAPPRFSTTPQGSLAYSRCFR